MEKKYYVYSHYRKDTNEIFYIGMGSINKRDKYKRSKAKDRRNPLWNNIVNKVGYYIKIVQEDLSLTEACDLEIKLISFYGKLHDETGVLSNFSSGGQGGFGFKPSKEHIEAVRIANLGSKRNKEQLQKMSVAQKNKIVSSEVGRKISIAKKNTRLGIKNNSFVIRVENIITGVLYKSVAAAAKDSNIRRNTFLNNLKMGNLPDFKIITEEYYCKKLAKRNIQKERIRRIQTKKP